MSLAKRYDPGSMEPDLQRLWDQEATYAFDMASKQPVFSVDTPPPTVSGELHLGHVFSYSHTDFVARYRRMRGHNVFYPMGFDDNGLPTERLVERRLGRGANDTGRDEFVRLCLEVSRETEARYESLWRRLGLSIDWRYSYRTIDEGARRAAQESFLRLLERDLAYRAEAPALWCPECRTAIAQAELADLARCTTFHTLAFQLADDGVLPIATTRPELLPACVAVFVNPTDKRYRRLPGTAREPLLGREVPILRDERADADKGTGAVMCCTFGDATDVAWWRDHRLPLVSVLGRDGRLSAAAGPYEGLAAGDARRRVTEDLRARGALLEQWSAEQVVPVHERCDTPVEILVTAQWFVRLLPYKEAFLRAGEAVRWHPPHMADRYREWVTNLSWDWCISRQRAFGVPFPVWLCADCRRAVAARRADLPLDPAHASPPGRCPCGSAALEPEPDVMDTWATSSLTPQIAGQWLECPELYARVYPFWLRPQAHEIIRTWAFYTLAMSHHHFGRVPWSDVMISGWGLAPAGEGKISKSRGGGPVAPGELIRRYSADAVRYWAAGTGPGKDALISEERVQQGAKLVTKLWNVARLAEPFVAGREAVSTDQPLSPADRWVLSRLQHVIVDATAQWQDYDYAAARSLVEAFFWRELADNYLEMAKLRLYDSEHPLHQAACRTLRHVLLDVTRMLAPLVPYVTEAVYLALYAAAERWPSVHRAPWPEADAALDDAAAEALGERLVAIATAVRRYKSEAGLSLAVRFPLLWLAAPDDGLRGALDAARADLLSVTRADGLEVRTAPPPQGLRRLATEGPVDVWLDLGPREP